MKLLYLFLAILLAIEEPVISVECWMDGHCRLLCKDGEDSIIRCRNRKRCCVPSRYLTIQPVTIHGILGWTTPQMSTTAPKMKTNITNR
ncbi:defensin beta 119 [Homo sapiens]|uniref:Isoform 2 of Beta-defensin 119 n=1 Tax=Homo sapiens TaxID=9606 RepID=Q8N690-2|nr:beta-defensin 119 isoform c precursor [Homo sapiens]AAM93915.1 defensin beta 120 [Homo sapiens]EAW76450.1 defensin, beta 119, isoform CRA_c [Homo sapiens]KAI2594329.1 defensin beta 119 [Homo sapiens]KAI4005036.1 defensin beta 119 [Homo sapiens]|eukprot:NP_697018.1 beta-defensin 119 isoform c precursor [Homo sapiens]